MSLDSTVFLVDDDEAVRESIVLLLEAEGFKVAPFTSAEAFLEVYQADQPGCVVLDVSMPGITGLQLQEILIERQITIPLIFITGHGDVPMSVKAMRAGAVDFIEKPFNDDILIGRIREAIELDLQLRKTEARKLTNAIHHYAESMVETIREPLVVLDEELQVLSANRAFYHTFQIAPASAQKQKFDPGLESVLWNIPLLKTKVETVVKAKAELHDLEVVYDMGDSDRKVIRCNACELWQPSFQPRRFLLTMEDITRRKQSEQQAESLLQSAPDAIVVVNHKSNIIFVNQRAINLFGYCLEELMGRNLDVLLPARFKSQHLITQNERLGPAQIQPETTQKDLFALHKDGREIPVDISISSFESTDDQLVVYAIRDISARKLIEDELRRHREHLEELVQQRTAELHSKNRELESYSYSIAHDLRTPLRAITSFSQIIKEDAQDNLTQKDMDHLNRVIAAGKKMSELIDDILELSRITRKEISTTRVNLSQIAGDIIGRLKHAHPNRVVECQVQDKLIAIGDERLLECVLQNLLENAWKFTQDKTPSIIQLGTLENAAEPTFFVKDNGIGFNMQYLENLFQPFRRLHTAAKYEGTGVGLATVKRIVQRHGGQIWAQSEKGDGATFYFSLPMKMP